jgi:hypothetical protein
MTCRSTRASPNTCMPRPEQHRRDVQHDLVDQPGGQCLLGDADAADQQHVPAAGRRAGLLDGGLDAAR